MTRAQDAAIERASGHENLLRDALDALRAYMDAVRFTQDKQTLMGAIRLADDMARNVLARAAQETGHA